MPPVCCDHGSERVFLMFFGLYFAVGILASILEQWSTRFYGPHPDYARFRAMCLNPHVPVDVLISSMGLYKNNGAVHLVLTCVGDDERCHQVLRAAIKRGWLRVLSFDVFMERSLAFYETYLTYRDPGNIWEPSDGMLMCVLDRPACVDTANKVAYLVQRYLPVSFESYFDEFDTTEPDGIVGRVMNHPDAAVRRQFPVIAPFLAGFLLQVPPRVQCRVLGSMGTLAM